MRVLIATLFASALAVGTGVVTDAHFKLLEPASWIVENERGDPQKAAPCGADPKAEMSKALTQVKGGFDRTYYRLRQGQYRAIFYFENSDIRVVTLEHRSEVYRLWPLSLCA